MAGTRTWRPPALHPITLVFAILSCWALIITLQLLLTRSQRENGILFAPDINALPLHSTFLYQYFPTILAVVFSIFWAWIDLETKRLEPYYRLGRKEGALGKESLLMHYPFDFVPLVPLRALRERCVLVALGPSFSERHRKDGVDYSALGIDLSLDTGRSSGPHSRSSL